MVSDSLPEDPREAFTLLYDRNEPMVMPIGFNTRVFMKLLEEARPFILEVLEDGVVLCGDKEFIEKVYKMFHGEEETLR